MLRFEAEAQIENVSPEDLEIHRKLLQKLAGGTLALTREEPGRGITHADVRYSTHELPPSILRRFPERLVGLKGMELFTDVSLFAPRGGKQDFSGIDFSRYTTPTSPNPRGYTSLRWTLRYMTIAKSNGSTTTNTQLVARHTFQDPLTSPPGIEAQSRRGGQDIDATEKELLEVIEDFRWPPILAPVELQDLIEVTDRIVEVGRMATTQFSRPLSDDS